MSSWLFETTERVSVGELIDVDRAPRPRTSKRALMLALSLATTERCCDTMQRQTTTWNPYQWMQYSVPTRSLDTVSVLSSKLIASSLRGPTGVHKMPIPMHFLARDT